MQKTRNLTAFYDMQGKIAIKDLFYLNGTAYKVEELKPEFYPTQIVNNAPGKNTAQKSNKTPIIISVVIVAAVLVGDLADIDPVVERAVDVGGVPFGALAHLSFLGGPGLGAVSLFVQFLAQLLGRADLDEAAEDVLHRPGFIWVDQQLLVVPVDGVSEDGYAAAVFPPALGCRHLVPDVFGDDLPLVLGEGDQDAEKHPAGGRR